MRSLNRCLVIVTSTALVSIPVCLGVPQDAAGDVFCRKKKGGGLPIEQASNQSLMGVFVWKRVTGLKNRDCTVHHCWHQRMIQRGKVISISNAMSGIRADAIQLLVGVGASMTISI